MQDLIKKANILIEALPYIQSFFGKTFVVKYGGAAQEQEDLKTAFAQDVVLLNYIGIRPIIVHGGGPKISRTMELMGKKPSFVHGHRVTDTETMDIVEMVLGGLINKEIVTLINSHGGRAVGLSGKDGDMIRAKKKKLKVADKKELVDIGLVGQVEEVNPSVINALDNEGFIPVIAPVGVGAKGETYNINGDDITAAIAASVKAEKIIYLTDVDAIRDAKGKDIKTITKAQAKKLMANGTISGGMVPKVSAALDALDGGVRKAHIINGKVPHCLLLEIFTNEGVGTEITSK